MEGSRKVTRTVDFYNLDVIISVGYRVSSHRGTQFRIWATGQTKTENGRKNCRIRELLLQAIQTG